MSLDSALPVYANTAVTADVDLAVAASANLRFVGFGCRETAATAGVATFRILNGSIASGALLVPVELSPNESRLDFLLPGLVSTNGISIDWVAGTFEIALYYMT